MTAQQSTAKPSKKATTPSEHPPYEAMVCTALASMKNRKGSSRQAIAKYVKANYKVNASADRYIKNALKNLVGSGKLVQPTGSGASGSFKLPKAVAEKKPKTVKKPAAAAKKPAVAKKATAKKTVKPKKAVKKSPKKAVKKAPAKKQSAAKKTPKKAVKPKKPAVKKVAKKPAAKKTTKAAAEKK